MVPLSSRQTIDLAAAALASGRGAGLPELLELVQNLSNRIDRVSISELSDLIEQDPAVAARLIGVANLIMHNPGMSALTSVSHAIHQIGFHRVRSLAISLLLIESTGARRNPPEQRQAAGRALCAGLLAQACARQLHAVDPEAVFACTTLRQLGRIVLPVVSLEHYRAAVRDAATGDESAAFRRQFGLDPLELSRELLRTCPLPADVREALGGDDSRPAGSATPAHAHRVAALADLGGRLGRLVLDPSVNDDAYRAATAALASEFTELLPAATELFVPALVLATDRLTQLTQVPGTSSLPEMLIRRLRSRLPRTEGPAAPRSDVPTVAAENGRPPAPAASPAPAPVAAAPARAPAPPVASRVAAPPVAPSPPPARDDDLPEGIDLLPSPARRSAGNEPWLEVLRPVRDGFAAGDCAVFLRSAGDGPFVLAEGVGPLATHHLDTAAVQPGEKTVFGIALTRHETVLIHDARTASLAAFLPAWFQRDPHTPASFLLLPLVAGDRVNGLVLVGWPTVRRIELTTGHESLLQLVRSSADRLCRETGRGSLTSIGRSRTRLAPS